MLQQQHMSGRYNELVLEYGQFTRHLPQSVEAIFVTPHTSYDTNERAKRVHAAFHAAYPGANAPILIYDPDLDKYAPFREVPMS